MTDLTQTIAALVRLLAQETDRVENLEATIRRMEHNHAAALSALREDKPRRLTSEEATRHLADVANGSKIAAIKLHRDLTGSGLKEAKDAVEAVLGPLATA